MEEFANNDYWKDWFDRHGPRLFLYAKQLTRSAADAEDVLQEAFVRFWKHQRHLGGEPIALVFASIRRTAIDQARSADRRARREETAGQSIEEPWFDRESTEQERTAEIEESLRQLPQEQREILVLRLWGELTYEQIGDQLGISPHTAASRYRHGMDRMRRTLLAKLP